MSEREPAMVWPLASFLCEELQARGWTTEDLAARMRNGRSYVVNLLCVDLTMAVQDDNLLLDDATSKGLSEALGVDEDFCRKLDDIWRRWPNRRQPFKCPESIFGPHAKAMKFRTTRRPIRSRP